jgi:hypothetical protein
MNEILTGGVAHYTMVVYNFDNKLDNNFDNKLDGDFDTGLPVACCWSSGGKKTVKKGEIWE